MIEGLAAGREPRAAAEELRQLLLEQLGQSYHDVKVEFKTLEDLDTLVNIGGANMAMARFGLSVDFQSNRQRGEGCRSASRQSSKEMKKLNLTKDQIQKLAAQLDRIRRFALRLLQFLPRPPQPEPRFDARVDQRSYKAKSAARKTR